MSDSAKDLLSQGLVSSYKAKIECDRVCLINKCFKEVFERLDALFDLIMNLDIPVKLNDLMDVNVPDPSAGDYLCYDGTEWIASPIDIEDDDVIKTEYVGPDLEAGGLVKVIPDPDDPMGDAVVTKLMAGPQWEWVTVAEGGLSEGRKLSYNNGNVYITGVYENTVDFFGTDGHSLQPRFNSNFTGYVAKYTSEGILEWIFEQIDSSGTEGNAVKADGNDVYVTGKYNQDITIYGNNGTAELAPSPAGNDSSMFLVKYDFNGNIIWTTNFLSTGNVSNSPGITVGESGNVYVTGTFTLDITFFSVASSSLTLNQIGPNPASTAFIVKYTSAGNVVWANQIEPGEGLEIVVDSSENIYVTGNLQGVTTVVGQSGNVEIVPSNNNRGGFLVKYDSDGDILWTSYMEQSLVSFKSYVSVSVSDGVYVTGKYQTTATFYGVSTQETISPFITGSDYSLFLIKYSLDGEILWIRRIGNSDSDATNLQDTGIAVVAGDSVYVRGFFNGTLFFEGTPNLELVGLPKAVSSATLYYAKYTTDGDIQWAISGPNESLTDQFNISQNLDLDQNCIYVPGIFLDEATFQDERGIFKEVPASGVDQRMFIGKLVDDFDMDCLVGILNQDVSDADMNVCTTVRGPYCYDTPPPLEPGKCYYINFNPDTNCFELTTNSDGKLYAKALSQDKLYIV